MSARVWPILTAGVLIILAGCDREIITQDGGEENVFWSTRTPMPTARQEMAAAVHGGKIYVFGGHRTDGSTISTAERYDPVTDTWGAIAPLPVGLNHPAAASVGDKIYVVGGSQSFPIDPERLVLEYEPATDIWRFRPSMPFARAALMAVTVDDKLYLIGGVGEQPGTVQEFTPAITQWRVMGAEMPTLREHHAATVSDGIIYVFSGRWQSQNVESVEAYDPINDTWFSKASIPTKRSGLAACAVNDTIYVLGGELPGVFATNERYLIASDVWEQSEPMLTARHGLSAKEVGGRIYAIGGGLVAGLRASGVVEVFTP